MIVVGAVVSLFLLQIAGSREVVYEVPEPLFEVFSPKGLRVSLPDSSDVKSVEFFITLPSTPNPYIKEVNHTDGSYWVYWNPNVVANLYDKINYKLMIQHQNVYRKKEGTHVVQKVIPLSNRSNDTDCTGTEGQKVITAFPSIGGEERHKGLITTGKTSSFKSSYSTQKSSDLKPITKSTTSTTSGTFFIKPSGVMEATGYKKGSTFDSTKKEGEQWEHYQSELTAEELENMRQLYGSGFHGFPFLTDKFFPGSPRVYEKSYMSSESKSFPGGVQTVRYGEGPVTTHQFHQTHKTQESSTVSHSKPVFQFHYTDSAGGEGLSTRQQSEKMYRLEPLTKLPNPLPPQGTIVKATEYVREEHLVPAGGVYVDRESHTSSGPQKIVQVSQTGEYSSHHNQEIVKPDFGQVVSTARRGDQLEYSSGNLQTVEKQSYGSRYYLGNIFPGVKSVKVKAPQECALTPGLDYTITGDIRQVEKYAHELGCLATLAESSVKEEMAMLRQKNGELSRKLEQLEDDVRRLSGSCNCYDK